ncbi:phosphate acyltransferase, partial [Bacteriovorax sp. DB6_IX]
SVKTIIDEGRIEPVLLGSRTKIETKMKDLGLYETLKDVEIITPRKADNFKEFYLEYTKKKQRDGVSVYHAEDLMALENYYGAMMV